MRLSESIGGLHCRHVGGHKKKRKFVDIVCIKMEVNSQRRKILLFLYTSIAAMTLHANHQLGLTSVANGDDLLGLTSNDQNYGLFSSLTNSIRQNAKSSFRSRFH